MLLASKIKHICLSGASKWGEEWWSDYWAWKLEFQGLCWMSSLGEVTFAWSFANRCGLWVWVDEFRLSVVLIWWCGFWISLDHVKLFWCVDEVSEYLSAQNHISLLGGIQFLKHCTIWGLFRCMRVSKTATTGLAATTQDLHLTQTAAAKQNSWGHLRRAEHPREPCACLAVPRVEEQTCNKCPTSHMSAWERWPALQGWNRIFCPFF